MEYGPWAYPWHSREEENSLPDWPGTNDNGPYYGGCGFGEFSYRYVVRCDCESRWEFSVVSSTYLNHRKAALEQVELTCWACNASIDPMDGRKVTRW